jgi:hypothetical protein
MTGVYAPEGKWLIEQEGVIPDIVVDNLPHETFNGRDCQLEAATAHLREKIAADPRPVPKPPAYPPPAFTYPNRWARSATATATEKDAMNANTACRAANASKVRGFVFLGRPCSSSNNADVKTVTPFRMLFSRASRSSRLRVFLSCG